MPERVKILFLSAEPMNAERLRLGEEIRDIEEKLQASPKARSFQLISQWSVRPRDLMVILMRHRPTIVHFSGHASRGKIILEDEKGGVQPIEGKYLAALLAGFRDTLRLVVLNACFTAEFNDLVTAIDYTVGTTSALSDSAAIRFSGCFYQALAFGNSVQTAYELARSQLRLEELDSEGVFSLLVREGVNTSEPFARPRSQPGPKRTTHFAANTGETSTRGSKDDSTVHESAPTTTAGTAGNRVDSSTHVSGSGSSSSAGIVRGISEQAPVEIKESLERFRPPRSS